MQPLDELRQYLQDRANLIRKLYSKPNSKYAGFEELVLDCGTVMKAQPLPKNIKRGLPKSCYWNSQQLAFKKKSLTYVEGYVLAEDISFPVAHAWLLTPEGYAIDPTWETPGNCYLGIPFSTKWLKSLLAERKKKGRDNDLSCPPSQNTINYRLWTIEVSTLDDKWCLTIYQPPGFYVEHLHLDGSRDEAIAIAKTYIDRAIGSP